jgi:hypothetical protein
MIILNILLKQRPLQIVINTNSTLLFLLIMLYVWINESIEDQNTDHNEQ